MNHILSIKKKGKLNTGNLFELLVAWNRATIANLDNIILSLLAKIDLLNALILDAREIDLIPTTDCFSTSDILVYKKLMILPVYHNVKMLQLEETTIAKCNNYTMAVRNCNAMQPTFYMALLTSPCALQLIPRNTAICCTSFNNMAPTV
uniref:Uncharacterized protein n=1 Tax=Glossina pallidipes TaxID=7398 RepID=A0A1B0ACI1_GLOPL